MHYISTRGGMPPARFTDILLEGLAPDGGLTVPEAYPRIDRATLAAWRPLGYRELALEVLARFIDDIAPVELRAIIERTYTARAFGSDEITPIKTLEPGIHLLGLSNGPTLAFKDVAMQLLGNLFEHTLARRGKTLNILGATSGDTGSAAEYAMRGKRGIRVFMLSPLGKMSRFQTAQMYSLDDPNVLNLAVRGVFDDCQHVVKRVSRRRRFQASLPNRHRELDQLGTTRGADGVLLQGVFRGDRERRRAGFLRGPVGQLRQRLRRSRGTA